MKRFAPALLLALPAVALAYNFDPDFDFENEKPWKEVESKLPPYPKEENLILFKANPASDNEYFVDANSIGVGADGVVRYTLVVKSPEGALNVSFQGIRCSSYEVRLYAFGRPDNSWGKARDTAWKHITTKHDAVLYNDFFCPREIIVTDEKEAVDALRAGNHPRAGKSSWF